MRSPIAILVMLAFAASRSGLAQDPSWPGLPPDCWTLPRNYHSDSLDWGWQERTLIEKVVEPTPERGEFSPNRAYFFVRSDSPNGSPITIFAEKDYLIRVAFPDADARYRVSVEWINENLLYLRPVWGRVAFTDMIFDVETEKVVYAKDGTDGTILMQQAQETCRSIGGCECIQKE
jgi:hypothetical protein